jgi:hypothetical protein
MQVKAIYLDDEADLIKCIETSQPTSTSQASKCCPKMAEHDRKRHNAAAPHLRQPFAACKQEHLPTQAITLIEQRRD